MIHGHGDELYRYNGSIRANFSSNVWYGGLNPDLQAHLQNKIATVTHYPDPGGETLQQAAAAGYGLQPEQLLVTNGAIEAIYLVAQAFSSAASSTSSTAPSASSAAPSATILTPCFSEYEDASRLHGLGIHYLPWDTAAPDTLFHTSLVFIGNPNNPTGLALPPDLLRQWLQRNPHTLFVIDESYIEFTHSTISLLPELPAYANLILIHSLTKSCCIPGLRLGFAIGSPDRIQTLRRYKMPWSVNRLAIEAGLYIFSNRQQFTLPLAQLLAATAGWRGQLQQATGWKLYPTDTHYFLVEIPASAAVPSAGALKQYLIGNHGLLIRDASNFRDLTPCHFRIACQSPEHNQLLTDALRQCSQTGI
jgi:threonine-phosphate decarboxylase